MSEEIQNTDQKSSYKGIVKATSLFGGVQVYQILVDLIKSKIIAIILGPAGVGIQGLYTSGIHMIQQLTACGLSSSAVRNVAEANKSGNKESINKTVIVLRRLVWITGLLGMFAVILFSPLLSRTSFGDSSHILGFVIISVTLLLTQISNGQKVILQGTRQYKYLAKCSAYGATIGLLLAIPLYYAFEVEAIVPNIVLTSATTLILSWFFSRKIQIEKMDISMRETFSMGKTMLSMGMAICLSQFLTSTSAYILRSLIRIRGGVEEVGLYTAGFVIMAQYAGLVFQAMGTDFYPRLASVNQNNAKCSETINQQGEIGFLLLGPLMILCIIFVPFLITILYSEKFLGVSDYIIWSALGVIFQMASWSISYVFIAKAESKTFIFCELLATVFSLVASVIGYYFDGLRGLGIAYAIKYIFYLLLVYFVSHKRYGFSFTQGFLKLFSYELGFVTLGIIIVAFASTIQRYLLGSLLFIVATTLSLIELNKRISIKSILKRH